MPHISLAAEKLWVFGGFPITNALLTTWVVMALLFGLAYLITKKISLIPGNLQSLAEIVIGGLFDFFSSVTGKHTSQFFPLLATIFLFVITANWVGLLPGVGTIGFFVEPKHTETVNEKNLELTGEAKKEIVIEEDSHEPVKQVKVTEVKEVEKELEFLPLFRGATADLNTTIAIGIVAIVAIQYFGFKTVGAHYSSRFLNFSDPIYFVVGILEIVSEFSKIISFAFRLFGNIFAGEVLLAVMAFLMPFFVPIPFLMMEIFVGFIQALVFSMLTAVFLNVAISHGEEH